MKEDNNPDEEGEKGKLAGSSSRHENEENVLLPADRSSEEITTDKVEGEGVGREDKSTDG